MTRDVYTPFVGAFATSWAAITTANATIQAAFITLGAVVLAACVTGIVTFLASRAVERYSKLQHELAERSFALQLELSRKTADTEAEVARRNRRLELLPRRWDMFCEFLLGARKVRRLIGFFNREEKHGDDFQKTFTRLYALSEDMTYLFGPDLKRPADRVISALENLLNAQDNVRTANSTFAEMKAKNDAATAARVEASAALVAYFEAGYEFLDFSEDILSKEKSSMRLQGIREEFSASDRRIQAKDEEAAPKPPEAS